MLRKTEPRFTFLHLCEDDRSLGDAEAVAQDERRRALKTVTVLEVAEDEDRFSTYLLGLSLGLAFRSRDEIDAAAWDSWRGGTPFGPLSVTGWMKGCALEVADRRLLVAVTWPARFETPLTVQQTMQREVEQLPADVTANIASLAWRWWYSHAGRPPVVDGHSLELGEALELLAVGWGISPSSIRRILSLRPVLLAVDELIDLVGSLRLTYTDAQPHENGRGDWPLATGAEVAAGRLRAADLIPAPGMLGRQGTGRWWVDEYRLASDMQLERRLLAHRDELAQQLRGQRPWLVHEKRIGCYGPPPEPTRSYYPLFAWLDQRDEARFQLSMEELADVYSGQHREFALIEPRPLNPGPLPPSARKHPGWWSNPRPQTPKVGRQPQRIAWLAAGYTAEPTVHHDPATGADEVIAVTFQEVPGRSQWHPFRERLRRGEAGIEWFGPESPTGADRFEETLAACGGQTSRWFDVAGFPPAAHPPRP